MAQLLVHSWTSVVLGEIERVSCTCVYTMQYLLTLRVHFILKKKKMKKSAECFLEELMDAMKMRRNSDEPRDGEGSKPAVS